LVPGPRPKVAHASRAPFPLSRWLRNSHLQTLGAALPFWAPRHESPRVDESVQIPLPGPAGGSLHARVTWLGSDSAPGRRPAIVVVHGVGGTSESRYVIRAGRAFARAGYHAVRLDLRGSGEGVRTAPCLYHAALTEDLAVAVDWLARSPRVDGVFVLGFSLGGQLALRWAGELGAGWESRAPALRAVATVSAPLDLERTTAAMERLRSLPYHRYLVQGLVQQGRTFAGLHPARVHYTDTELDGVRSIRAYDALVVAPMHGFRSAEDYYARASAGPLVRAIEVPTLLVHAEDDPMVPAPLVRDSLGCAPAALEQAWSEHGGHVGWIAGVGEQRWLRTWAMDRVFAFFDRHARGASGPP